MGNRGSKFSGGRSSSKGVRNLGGNVSQQEVIDAINNIKFVPNSSGSGYTAGVQFRDQYKIENRDGSIESTTRTVLVRDSISQGNDGKWYVNSTDSGYASRATAERNARKSMVNEAKQEGGFGRTLSMRTGTWKR